jgi:anti-sigma B factor antagonist
MIVEIEHQTDVCSVRFEGRFATGNDWGYLSAKMDEIKCSGCRKVLLDFRQVPYIDSTGIGFVVSIYTRVTKDSDGAFVLVGPTERVREVLDLTRLSSILPITDDIPSGLALLNARGSAARVV